MLVHDYTGGEHGRNSEGTPQMTDVWKIHLESLLQVTKLSVREGLAQEISTQHFGRPRRADHEVKRSTPSWPT